MRELDEEVVKILIEISFKSNSPVSLHMKLFNVVVLEDLGKLRLGQPAGGLDDQVDEWSPGSRDDLPKRDVDRRIAKILV